MESTCGLHPLRAWSLHVDSILQVTVAFSSMKSTNQIASFQTTRLQVTVKLAFGGKALVKITEPGSK